jgi:hypothetical protein
MVAAYLFTLPDPRMGPAATDLFRVKVMTEVVITVGGWEWHYPRGRADTNEIKSGGDTNAQLLWGDGVPLDLAKVAGAVAVAVDDGSDCRIVWLSDGQCVAAERCRTMAVARALIG